jgi:uroporphyrin-III C-methyltransferase
MAGDKNKMAIGKVYLVGAGPGDPGLLTVKARDLIAEADCIIYDHLVNSEILDFARADAELIYAGKQGHLCGVSQDYINALMIAKATEHNIVVRLKGGDPFVFGRGGEEALALVEAGIEFEVAPGVSSGIAAATYAGIPVTHRGLSSSVAFITGHEDPTKLQSSLDWERLAVAVDTLVIFMCVAKIGEIAQRLIQYGRSPETPLAIVCCGTYAQQTTHTCTLGEASERVKRASIASPAIIIVGQVVSLRERLKWFMADLPSSDWIIREEEAACI